MNLAGKIVCRTVGAAGMYLSLSDAAKVSKLYKKIESEHVQENYLEKAYYDARTIDAVSYSANAAREKTFELRSKSKLPEMVGRCKGSIKGFLYGIGNFLPMVACSALALISKGFWAKAGAIGIGAIFVRNIARSGFGVGKHNPINS
ncbi:MAG: hypothetical protein MJ237_02275 [bacterium]|nr:hypothetical protein [bacterium]